MNGLATQYGDRVDFEVVSTTDPGAAARIERYGFDIHGMYGTSGHKATPRHVADLPCGISYSQAKARAKLS